MSRTDITGLRNTMAANATARAFPRARNRAISPAMMRKRSISIQGHRTSIALEPVFWSLLDQLAASQKRSLPDLIGEVDQMRLQQNPASGPPPGLASALRVFVVEKLLDAGATL